MKSLALVFMTGFTQPDHPTAGSGLWTLRNRLGEIYPQAYMSVVTWDGPADQRAWEAVVSGAQLIIPVAYSWGAGRALPRFCSALEKYNRRAGLACLIDPVPCIFPLALSALCATDRPFKLPAAIDAYASWRTLNKTGWTMPWGREVSSERAVCVYSAYFGTFAAAERYQPRGHFFPDDRISHTTIDNEPRVHDTICQLIAEAVQ